MEAKTCELCGKTFLPEYRVTKAYWARRRFCSDECRQIGHCPPPRYGTGRPPEVRFWTKVRRGYGCWEWVGARIGGYGVLARGASGRPERWIKAHRLSWEIHNGPIPEGAHVLHSCDNPGCINPAHLRIGSHKDNMLDRDTRGGNGAEKRRGERNGRAVLTDDQVCEIRSIYRAGGTSQLELGRKFCVSEAQIWRIVNGRQRKAT